jgi:hypothetical protein
MLPLLAILVAASSAMAASAPVDSLPPAPRAEEAAPVLVGEREYFVVGAHRRPLVLAHGDVAPASVRVTVGGRPWRAGGDYRLRARSGQVVPMRPWAEATGAVAVVEYRFRPGGGGARVGLRPMAAPPGDDGDDDAGSAAAAAATSAPAWSLDDTGRLDVRGSKAIYVSSGTRRELTVDQNLRLNISGSLTDDIVVRASLTDDNLPVVPEGNTEELQDIDKVLVELVAPNWKATLGDFVAVRSGTVFGGYRRKLQGFSLEATPGAARAEALFGSPRGRYRTVEIQGQESNQGPYFLGGGDAGRNLFVVAGSERVVLDGEPLTRGADRDYVIDYVRGTVTFTYRRLITADSIIVVEFEEGEGSYARGVVGGGGGAVFSVLDAPASVGVRLTREKDDPSRLRTGELSAADEAILAAAGSDPLAAVAQGAVQVDPGAGDYDRLQDAAGVRYVFNENGGDWQVQFFHAGEGLGDYDLDALTETGVRIYVWVGEGLGAYRVGRLLPLPSSQSMVSLRADVGDSTGAGLHAEWNLSSLDANVLSDLDDGDNDGAAAQVSARTGDLDALGGRVRASATWEDRDEDFAPFLRHRSVYDYEGWGLGDRARRDGFLDEADAQLEGRVGWETGADARSLSVDAALGRLEHGEGLSADRVDVGGAWRLAGGRGRHRWREATAEDAVDPLDILRREQDHEVAWNVGPLVPRTRWRRQSWRDDARTGDQGRGYRRKELTGGLGSRPGAAWAWDLAYTRGLADSLRADRWQGERDSRTWQGRLGSPRVGGVRVLGDATVREVRRPDGQDETTRLARVELVGAWADLGSDWSLGYSVDNSRTEVLARQVVYVGENQGRYDEQGNFVGDGRGDYDVILAGTDSLVATTAVRTDLSWRQDFAALGRDRLWGAWTSTTRLGVEARSRTDDIGGLLRLDPAVVFDPTATVLGRVDLSEEVALLRHLRAWDLRWRFDYAEAMDRQYAQGREDRLRRNHTATLTWNPTASASVRLRGGHDDDRRDTDAAFDPLQLGYDSLTRRGEMEGSWRPAPGSRLALAAEYLTRDDAVSGVGQRETALRPSLRWRLAETWSLQGECRISDVVSDEPVGSRRPYFYPSAGTNVEASSRVGWDPSKYLTFALAWFARKPGGREWQHDLRLESTARF